MKASPEQVFALAARFATKVNFLKIEGDRAQLAIDNANDPLWGVVESALVAPKQELPLRPIIEVLSETPKPCDRRSVDDQIADQGRFYNTLGWTFVDSGLVIPLRRSGFDRLLVMVNTSLTNNGMYDLNDASFRCWRYSKDLNEEVPDTKDERHPSRGPYAIWVRDCIEADENNNKKSAKNIKEEGIRTITLLERMYLEALVYRETGQHLDTKNFTLCSGSRNPKGNVPCVRWGSRFEVGRTDVDKKNGNLRARQVIVL
jgi:hypothetical protein